MLSYTKNGLVAERAQHNHIYPTLQVVGDVCERLTISQTRLRAVDKNCRTTQCVNRSLKRNSRAQRRLFKEHYQLLSVQRSAEQGWGHLHLSHAPLRSITRVPPSRLKVPTRATARAE